MTLPAINIISISGFLASASFFGMVFIIAKYLRTVRQMAKEGELVSEQLTQPLVKNLFCSGKKYLVCFWKNFLTPFFYKITEKTFLKFAGFAKRIELKFIKLSNYVKGKRKIKNGQSNGYWNNIIEFKNGLNDEDKGKE
ncbi:MAG: hypothetical protein ABIJ28_01400 [Patescibacteria group bacterium]